MSRETRRLLAAVALSLGVLWVLARVRFRERPPDPNPVVPLLTQLAPRPAFEDLERTLLAIEPRVVPLLSSVPSGPSGTQPRAVALRLASDRAVAITHGFLDRTSRRDAATGVAVVALEPAPHATLDVWDAAQPDIPRVVLVTEPVGEGVSLRPVFLGRLERVWAREWAAFVRRLPAHAAVPHGAFVFTTEGVLIGAATGAGDRRILVPGAVVLDAAARLLREDPRPPGWLGVEAQPVTPSLAAAAGAPGGAIVTFVDTRGPAAGRVAPTDVIESLDGASIDEFLDWETGLARVAAGQSITIGLRRSGQSLKVVLEAVALPEVARPRRLGVTMRRAPSRGAVVVAVEPGSAAALAGLAAGDLVTRVGVTAAPTPVQLERAFTTSNGRGVLVAVQRGREHRVLALGAP